MKEIATKEYIYAIGESEYGPVKIGITQSMKDRLSQIQTSHYTRLKILAYVCVQEHGRLIEQMLHALLKTHAIRGEWFDIAMSQQQLSSLVTHVESMFGIELMPAQLINKTVFPANFDSDSIIDETQFTYAYTHNDIEIEIFVEDDEDFSQALHAAKTYIETLLPYL